ncbi:MAG: hypothetical protein ACRDI2_24580, partial [Chloroflexota bacterium]
MADPEADLAGVPREFVRRVRDALARLHDPVCLQTHPLARRLAAEPGSAGAAGRTLHRLLSDAIAQLHPGSNGTEGTRAWRRHRLLHLRYVDALPPPAVQATLRISKAEYYREHDEALAAVASLLAEHLS